MQVRNQYRNVEGYVVEVFEEIPCTISLDKGKYSFHSDGMWKFRACRTTHMTKTICLGVSWKQIETTMVILRDIFQFLRLEVNQASGTLDKSNSFTKLAGIRSKAPLLIICVKGI